MLPVGGAQLAVTSWQRSVGSERFMVMCAAAARRPPRGISPRVSCRPNSLLRVGHADLR